MSYQVKEKGTKYYICEYVYTKRQAIALGVQSGKDFEIKRTEK